MYCICLIKCGTLRAMYRNAISNIKHSGKFIIAGDFAQLLPVKDRIENCDYKNSLALHELCDGNRLELTKCRRSDAVLFNMLLPENINNIKRKDFKTR